MKVALTVKNTGRAIAPKKGDVMIYDGEMWYITTKEDLLAETRQLLDRCKSELEALKAENANFKSTVAQQMLDMSGLIRNLYSEKGE